MIINESNVPVHQSMFRSLLKTPHKRIDETLQIHKQQFSLDPSFYGKIATWSVYHENNIIRDVNEIFIAMLFASDFPEHREAAFVMLQSLPLYQVARVVRCYTGYNEFVRHSSLSKKPAPVNGNGVTVLPLLYGKKHPKAGEKIPRKTIKLKGKLPKFLKNEFYVDYFFVKHECLNKKMLRGLFVKAVKYYLKNLESPDNLSKLEFGLIRGRKWLKQLYRRVHLVPMGDENSWLNQYLFRDNIVDGLPPRVLAFRQLIQSEDPIEQAKIIEKHKLPYPQVISVVKNITPTVLVALISVMSHQELMSNLSSLKSRGAMNNCDIKNLIQSKLDVASKSKNKRIDAMKGDTAAKHIEGIVPDDIVQSVKSVSDKQLKFHGQITAKTALLIDKSGSMETSIELGKQLAAAIAQSCKDNDPIVYLFDNIPTEIKWKKSDGDITTKSAWDKKLSMFRASGGTEPHKVLMSMIERDVHVEQIVIITDEGENNVGKFTNELQKYNDKFGVMPNIVIVRVSSPRYVADDLMEKSMKSKGIDVEVLVCDKLDQIAMPNLLQMLSRNSIFQLILEISEVELPSRKE